VDLGSKLRSLRSVEGALRNLGRPMTQPEVVRAMKKEIGRSISQSYLSQIESGTRPHLTANTRELLAKFFRVEPGFLVNDPEGYHSLLISDLRVSEDQLDGWLAAGAHRFASDPKLAQALEMLVQQPDTRGALLLIAEILRAPGLAQQLNEILMPQGSAA
jgi:transcriptional regulator with XRE-family HTH domain